MLRAKGADVSDERLSEMLGTCGGCTVPLILSGGGFFLSCEDCGRVFDHLFPACAFFLFFIFFLVEISSRTLIPLSMPESVHSGSAS